MSNTLNIKRRDFLNGMALSLAAGTCLTPREILAASGGSDYPPALTGLRGSHVGSFEVAHAVAWGGKRFSLPSRQRGKDYDLVVAGGGISGLAAAHFFRQQAGTAARILILDNHDDFGGHAKRNEFTVNGQRLIGYGGSQSLEAPGAYSAAAKGLLRDVGVDTQQFYRHFDQDYFDRHKLGTGLFFDGRDYGKNKLAPSLFGYFMDTPAAEAARAIVDTYPISADARDKLIELMYAGKDYLAGRSNEDKIRLLQSISYTDYLHRYTGATAEVTRVFREEPRGIWGVGWDALSALEATRWGDPGTRGLGVTIPGEEEGEEKEEPYIFHFPDGNAGVARALVHTLIPEALGGVDMASQVLPQVDYSQLDLPGAATAVRLNSTVVDIRHTTGNKQVDVTYVRRGEVERVRAAHVIHAAYHNILPHICEELPASQVAAIGYATKVPMAYINVALTNWRSFAELGVHNIRAVQPRLMHGFGLDFPVSMGGYQYSANPDQPVIVHGSCAFAAPDSGLNCREQHKLGRRELYDMSFADFEAEIIRQMGGALAGGGFEPERDIAAITVNRWPHGYAYEYNDLSDDPSFGPDKGPHIAARKQLGRISIANSDASAYAYVDGAIDAAYRAVNEQVS